MSGPSTADHRPHGVAHLPGAFVGLAVYDSDAPTATEADE